ncbi:hypothetical protein Pint_12872 [Pistacia integerrima]|uniref:Uncharacterized protein n=1 Tax=Pistacia integerrima TaxID=434235 RepID=A0ACC0YAP9_9ROSI|nr:hypothetical protein Pint_12872 [Pistacia integerrima]
MSKSAPSDQSRINILDPKDVIVNKIKRCKTDSYPGLEFDNPERPECNNLLSIYQLMSGKTKELGDIPLLKVLHMYNSQEVAEECHNMNWGTFKSVLTDALIEHLHPIQLLMCVKLVRMSTIGACNVDFFSSVYVYAVVLFFQMYDSVVRHAEIISDSTYLDKVLAEGASKAGDIADATLNNVYQAMGFLRT